MTLETGQTSLLNFFNSIKFYNPSLADLMGEDLAIVGLWALGDDKGEGQKAADRLRRQAFDFDLPEIHRRVLEGALTDLGYS